MEHTFTHKIMLSQCRNTRIDRKSRSSIFNISVLSFRSEFRLNSHFQVNFHPIDKMYTHSFPPLTLSIAIKLLCELFGLLIRTEKEEPAHKNPARSRHAPFEKRRRSTLYMDTLHAIYKSIISHSLGVHTQHQPRLDHIQRRGHRGRKRAR